MNVLNDIQPKEVLRFFEAICDLPHGSRNTKVLSDFCVVFARLRGLWCHQDKANNVIIRKEASLGYEDHPPVIIQGHLDMVCERDAGVEIDFRRDGLRLTADGDYIRAQGTTLGADNGIAVAYALALLDDKNLVHPPLEVLLTSDEEIGMLGAMALDVSPLKGKTLINLDSDVEGVLTLGCAGGLKGDLLLPLRRESVTGTPYTLQVTGLTGGHSGVEIGCGRTNAITFVASLFDKLCAKVDARPFGFTGGGKDNAIPRTATLKFLCPTPLSEEALALVSEAERTLRETEPNAAVTLTAGNPTSQGALTRDCRDRMLELFRRVPNGVQKMSEALPDMVETSLNLGIISFEKSLCATFALRSNVNAELEALSAGISALAKELGAQWRTGAAYPAWEMREHSPLRDTMVEVWRTMFGGTPRTETIHAGLECGVFADKIKGLDCVSMGPTMLDIHTPREALSISSTERTWRYLLAILKAL